MRFNINWNITRRCNLRCRHCYFDAGAPQEKELSTEEAFAVIDDIAATFSDVVVTFGGGEPLVREDIFEILAYGKERGLKMSLATNGTLLDESTALKLKDCSVSEVIIPIDGTKRTHDWLRRTPNEATSETSKTTSKTIIGTTRKTPQSKTQIKSESVFERAVSAAKACKRAGLRLVIDPCIMRENASELSKILDIAESLRADQCRIFHFISLGRGSREVADSELSIEEYAKTLFLLYEEQCKRKNIEICTTQACQYWVILRNKAEEGAYVPDFYWREVPGCRAGICMLSIKPNGNVVPCPLLDVCVGNVKEASMRDILKSDVLDALRKREVKGRCADCEYVDICGGCRVRALVESGDFLAEDPLCGAPFFKPARL